MTRSLGSERAQSHVVGIALLLSMTLLAVAGITAGIGTVVDENAARADADRVTADLDDALRPAETTGVRRGTVRFGDGDLRTVERDLRVLNDSGTVRVVDVDALVYTVGDRRVAFLGGALTRGAGEGSRLVRPPSIVAAPDGGDLLVGAPRLGGTVSASGTTEHTLRTDVSHERTALGEGRYRVAVETTATAAWVDAFESRNATVVATDRDFDGDGVGSVVARFPDRRTAYLIVHEMRLEVTDA